MKLKVWTSSKPDLINPTIGKTLLNLRPEVPPHEFISYDPAATEPPLPQVGEVVLVCGNKCLDVLKAAKIAPKGRTIASLREKPILRQGGGYYLITFDPAVTNSEPEKKDTMDWDVRLAIRLMKTGSTKPVVGQYKWVNDYAPMIERIEKQFAKTGKPVDVGTDLETMGFYPWYTDKDIISISFSDSKAMAEVLYLGPQQHPVDLDPTIPLFDQIQWLLTSPKVSLRLANGKFDMIWIGEKWGIECTNFKLDTMLVGTLLDENRSNSLNVHAKSKTDMGGYDDHFNSKYDKGKMEAIPADEDLLIYAGGDTDAVLRAAEELKGELLNQPDLARFYVTILHPAARTFEKIERRGVLVDTEKYAKLEKELDIQIAEDEKKALDLLPNRLRLKHLDKIQDQLKQGKNPLTSAILKDFFFTPYGLNLKAIDKTPKTGEPTTAKSHLKKFAHVPHAKQMLDVLMTMDSAGKTRSTFVRGFLKHLRPDGRIHPTYFLGHSDFEEADGDDSGTVTGRLSAKNPAFQTLPKKTKWAKKIRECFPAPPGKVILMIDYSQGELKVVACIAPEKTMLASFAAGLDMHAVTGAQLAQVPLEEFLTWKDNPDESLAAIFDLNRSNAKPANFGLLYGMSAQGFMNYSWSNYGMAITLEEAEFMRNAFFQLYSGLPTFHTNQKKLVKLNKQVVSPLGRIRHLPTIDAWDQEFRAQAERQGINSPVQSTLTDMMIWALAILDEELGDDLEVVGMIHDAFVAYVDEDKVQSIAQQASEIMSNLPFHKLDWQPQLKFTVDAEVSATNLAEMKKFKLAA